MKMTLRIAIVAGISAISLIMAGLYVGTQRAQVRAAASSPGKASAAANLDQLLDAPHVVFRSTELGQNYGRLSVVALDDPAGPRATAGISCERVYATAGAGVCVTAKRGVVAKYGVVMLDAQLREVNRTALNGLPSRARMSTDGSLVATTTFVTGHSYASSTFSTETIVRRGGALLGNIEDFTTTVDGQDLTAVDRNFWGVTFAADNDTFYATGAAGGTTWLMKGSFAQRTMTALQEDAECPSLSPDGSKVAYKKRLGNKTPGVWRLAVLDLATHQEVLLAETRNVDDQVEWLDDEHLAYALARPGSDATTTDVWSVPADGTGKAMVLIEHGASPAVVRGMGDMTDSG